MCLRSCFAVLLLGILTSASHYGVPQHKPSRLHFPIVEEGHVLAPSDADLAETVDEVSKVGGDLKKQGYGTPVLESVEKVLLQDSPTTISPQQPSTMGYVLNEKAAEAYWKTRVPPKIVVPTQTEPPNKETLKSMEAAAPQSQPHVNKPVPTESLTESETSKELVQKENLKPTDVYAPPTEPEMLESINPNPSEQLVAEPPKEPVQEEPLKKMGAYAPPTEPEMLESINPNPSEQLVAEPPKEPVQEEPLKKMGAYAPPTEPEMLESINPNPSEQLVAEPPKEPVQEEPLKKMGAYAPPTEPEMLESINPNPSEQLVAEPPKEPANEEPLKKMGAYAPPTEPSAEEFVNPSTTEKHHKVAVIKEEPAHLRTRHILPSASTIKYVLNHEAAKKYWATAKFPTTTVPPAAARGVPSPAEKSSEVSQDEPSVYPYTGPKKLDADELNVHNEFPQMTVEEEKSMETNVRNVHGEDAKVVAAAVNPTEPSKPVKDVTAVKPKPTSKYVLNEKAARKYWITMNLPQRTSAAPATEAAFVAVEDKRVKVPKMEYVTKSKMEYKDKAEHVAKDKAEHVAKDKAEHVAKDKAEHVAKDKAEHVAKDKAEHVAKDKAEQKPIQFPKQVLPEEKPVYVEQGLPDESEPVSTKADDDEAVIKPGMY